MVVCRYVAFLWNPFDPSAQKTATRLAREFSRCKPAWHPISAGDGAAMFHRPFAGRAFESLSLPQRAGVILGTLFPRDLAQWSLQWRPQLDERFAEMAIASRGRRVVEELWGRYIVILNGRAGRDHYVIRDCSGHVPCFTTRCGQVDLIFSDIDDLVGLPLGRFTINRRFLAGFIFSPEMAQRECGLNEVTELLAGDCLAIEDARTRQFFIWDPTRVCRGTAVENVDGARRALASVVQTCVECWASRYDRIIHRLSGGLDSAIVLGCLRRSCARPTVICVNMHSDCAESDERVYAHLAASQDGSELIELPLYPRDAVLDERVLDLPKSARPSVSVLFETLCLQFHNLLAQQYDAEATWTGHGGDHLFFQSSMHFGAIDYAHARGAVSSFWPAVRDAVRLSGMPYWQVLWQTALYGWLRAQWRLDASKRRRAIFLRPELSRNIAEYVEPPWSSASADLPAGKRVQIAILAELLNRHRPIPGQYAPQHHPLLSQPLMEVCLQIPTYTLLRGGRDRALARDAFSDRVPPQIIARTGKGTTTSSLMRLVRRSASFVKDLVMEGELIREGIVDRTALEPYVAHGRPVDQWTVSPLLSCIVAEIWLRKWTAAGLRLNGAAAMSCGAAHQ